MKWKLIIYLSIFFYMIISPNDSNAHSPPDPLEGLLENHVFIEKSVIGPFEEKAAVTKFVSVPARCGAIICMIPCAVCGAIIVGTFSLVFSPFIAIKEKENILEVIEGQIYYVAFGAGILGSIGSNLGEIIIGTPFYLTQLVFYDLPKVVFHKDDKK